MLMNLNTMNEKDGDELNIKPEQKYHINVVIESQRCSVDLHVLVISV